VGEKSALGRWITPENEVRASRQPVYCPGFDYPTLRFVEGRDDHMAETVAFVLTAVRRSFEVAGH